MSSTICSLGQPACTISPFPVVGTSSHYVTPGPWLLLARFSHGFLPKELITVEGYITYLHPKEPLSSSFAQVLRT